ncbi:MAG: P-loop NTPase [Candidatus Methanodesulfokora sp.]|jgi:MinD superfamily P-loop ATPase
MPVEKLEITVISGKGGVGKTTVSSSLLYLFHNRMKVVAADADVDTPSLHLILSVEVAEKKPLFLSSRAKIREELCSSCGICAEKCPFGAIEMGEKPMVIEYMCDGCSVCEKACPLNAIELVPFASGNLIVGRTRFGFPIVTAQLEVGEHNSGLLVNEVRRKAFEIYKEVGGDVILTDGAPGIGCPVISSLSATEYAVIVTEPTPEALQGADRILEITRHFRIPSGIIINKYNMSGFLEKMVRHFELNGSRILGMIPLDFSVVESISNARPVVEHKPNSGAAVAIKSIFDELVEVLDIG